MADEMDVGASLTTTPMYDYEDTPGDEGYCNRTDALQLWASFTPVFFSIVIILSLLGNSLIIYILAKYENVRSLTNALILNLAMSDLLFTAGLPFWTYYHMYQWNLGEAACKSALFLFNVGYYSSGLLLIVMTVHRYLGVMKPLSPVVSAAGAHSLLVSLAIWMASIAVASPTLISAKVLEGNQCESKDGHWKRWGIYQQNLLFVLTALVFIFCYPQIMCRLLRASRQRRNNKTVKLIFTLLLVFFLGWGPFNVVIFLKTFPSPPELQQGETLESRCAYKEVLTHAFSISRILAYSHCCLNPVFYVLLGVKFRNHLRRAVRSVSGRESSVRSRHTRLTITSLSSGDDFPL
ncbi:chemokine XC receptor 1-like [Neosynchiropus ocellatus]